jgi:hypothetical protein
MREHERAIAIQHMRRKYLRFHSCAVNSSRLKPRPSHRHPLADRHSPDGSAPPRYWFRACGGESPAQGHPVFGFSISLDPLAPQ